MTEPEWTEWVGKEYEAWENALAESTVDNFKLNPMVRRMLSCDLGFSHYGYVANKITSASVWSNLLKLDRIGTGCDDGEMTSAGERFVHWALKIIEAAPKSIVEIGGGCGQLYATLRLLGWEGDYQIFDLVAVQEFQRKYLDRVNVLFGVDTDLVYVSPLKAMFASFYALGEFDEGMRQYYVLKYAKNCPKGLIVWNPGPGYSPEIRFPFPVEIAEEVPLTAPGNKVITWGM